MKKFKYILTRIKKMDFKNMIKIAHKVSKKSHKLFIYIFIDMIVCGFKYGAGYYDYQEFEFYNLTGEERKTYLTRVKNNSVVSMFNKREDFYKFDDKETFNKIFKKYLKRDYLVIDDKSLDKFKKFVSKHPSIIVKPLDGEGGHGVMKYEIDEESNIDVLFDTLLKCNQRLVEECIVQHDEISKLYDGSVNSLRLFTFFDGKDAYVLNSIFKIGNGGVTDNFSSGSMYTFLNEDGKVICPAIDRDDNYFEVHPITKMDIIGFEVPFYKEACKLVMDASKEVDTVKYIGWDVAITKDGPAIIEGNSFPGVFQIKPSFDKTHTGILPKYEECMKIKL